MIFRDAIELILKILKKYTGHWLDKLEKKEHTKKTHTTEF